MKKFKIRKGDNVRVVAGAQKGSEGKVVKIISETGRVIVEGINLVKKHTKPSAQSPQGGIVEKESSIDISNLSILTADGNITRIGYRIEDDKKVRYSKKSNIMEVPKLKKIVISKGVGAAVSDKKLIDYAVDELTQISGQKAVPTLSKKDVASFKLRKGMPIGTKVTLRGEKMYEFLDRLVTVALPRVRDFQGVKATGFDGRGNYNLGVTEQIIFPEINIDKVNKIGGMDITFVTNAHTDKEAKSLLNELGLPFKKN
jgi:large subunit ribosomal protein L5